MARIFFRRELINYSLIVVLLILSVLFLINSRQPENGSLLVYFIVSIIGIFVIAFNELRYHSSINLNQSEKLILLIVTSFLKDIGINKNDTTHYIFPFFSSYNPKMIQKNIESIYNDKNPSSSVENVQFSFYIHRVYFHFILVDIVESKKLKSKNTETILNKYTKALSRNSTIFKLFKYYYQSTEFKVGSQPKLLNYCLSLKNLGMLAGNEEHKYKKAIYKILKRRGLTEKSELYSRLSSHKDNVLYSTYTTQTYSSIDYVEYSSYKDILKAEIIANFYFNRYNVTETNIYRYVQQYVLNVTQSDFMLIINNKKSLKLICELINNSGYKKSEYLDYLYDVAAADKIFSDKEDAYINIVAAYLNIDKKQVAKIRNEYIKQGVTEKKTKRKTYKKTSSFSSSVYTFYSSKAYKILGIDKTASAEEVKKAYRTLVKKNHPDKFATQGEEAMEEAEDRFQVITEAYELIKRLRGIK